MGSDTEDALAQGHRALAMDDAEAGQRLEALTSALAALREIGTPPLSSRLADAATDLLPTDGWHRGMPPEEAAAMCLALSGHLSHTEHHKGSLDAAEQAVDLYRTLVDAPPRPKAPPPPPTALSDPPTAPQEARGGTRAMLLRVLTRVGPWATVPRAIGSIANLSARLGLPVGSTKQRRSLGIRRRLTRIRKEGLLPAIIRDLRAVAAPDVPSTPPRRPAPTPEPEPPHSFVPELALSLGALGKRLGALERHQEALSATEESAEHYRALAAEDPAQWRPALARILNDLGIRLSDTDRLEGAIEASREALAIRRELAAEAPQTYRAELALNLYNLSIDLSDLGQWDKAQETCEEAVQIYQSLFLASPATAREDLEDCLGMLEEILETTDQDLNDNDVFVDAEDALEG